MALEKSVIGKDFFDKLELVDVNMESFKDKNKIGFETEDSIGKFRILTKRIEQNSYISYHTNIFNGLEPQNILIQKKSMGFRKAIQIHYSVLNYLSRLKDKNN